MNLLEGNERNGWRNVFFNRISNFKSLLFENEINKTKLYESKHYSLLSSTSNKLIFFLDYKSTGKRFIELGNVLL